MSAENDLALAYHMGYDDALAKRKPDASKAQVLAPYDLAAENAKLRDERDGWKKLCVDQEVMHIRREETLDNENTKLRERVAELEGLTDGKRYIPQEWYQLSTGENTKLRELVRDYERCTMHADCAGCEYDGKLSTHCPLSPCFPDADELCELGIEVDR